MFLHRKSPDTFGNAATEVEECLQEHIEAIRAKSVKRLRNTVGDSSHADLQAARAVRRKTTEIATELWDEALSKNRGHDVARLNYLDVLRIASRLGCSEEWVEWFHRFAVLKWPKIVRPAINREIENVARRCERLFGAGSESESNMKRKPIILMEDRLRTAEGKKKRKIDEANKRRVPATLTLDSFRPNNVGA